MDRKLKNANDILRAINDGLTQEDFTKAFKTVIEYVQNADKKFADLFKTGFKALSDRVDEKLATVRDGRDGRNPLTVSKTPPINPEIGDLWYQP